MEAKSQHETRRLALDPHAFSRIDLLSIPGKERFDYWRHLFFGSIIDRDRSEWSQQFRGQMLSSADHNGIAFANLRADPLICTFGKRDSGLVLLGLVREGSLKVRSGKDDTAVMEPASGLILFDCDRPAVTSSTRYDLSYLAFPRAVVTAAMGGDPIPRGQALRTLPHQGLAPILHAHLRAMAAYGGPLAPTESRAAIQAASALALTLLSRLNPRGIADSEAIDEALFTAARRYIQTNLGHHTLTAESIAAAVGCSRARLYRIFAQKDQTVGDCLREVRMSHASRLLETQLDESIASIAFYSGYTDLSAFGKAFRRRFGMSPSDWRVMRTSRDLQQPG